MSSRTSITPTGPGFFTNLWHAFGLFFWVILLRILNHVRIQNLENIPKRGEHGVLICSNHISALDPFVIAVTAMPFFSPVWWRAPAKEELFRWPLVRTIIGTWGGFPVRRGKRDFEAIETMTRLLPVSVIVIFPEGRRSPDGRLQPGKAGVGKIIYDAKPAKVIPVMIEGSDRLLPKGRILPRLFQTVTITYGAPLDLSRFFSLENSIKLSQQVVDVVMQSIEQLRRNRP
ncbi:MAG: 1-acyl-sn-glycerol-3-phosphate acyltransferase [Nitrospirae bacterium]|nr:1-acyl-sn-glycerol-3-phosphate acyltransferase [Nitrospirota bacterium]